VDEFLPLLFGVACGWLAGGRPASPRFKAAVALAIALGPVASWVNGELVESAWLVVFDVAQVAAAFAMTVLVMRRLPARRAGRWEG
jgi:hypothetical protein